MKFLILPIFLLSLAAPSQKKIVTQCDNLTIEATTTIDARSASRPPDEVELAIIDGDPEIFFVYGGHKEVAYSGMVTELLTTVIPEYRVFSVAYTGDYPRGETATFVFKLDKKGNGTLIWQQTSVGRREQFQRMFTARCKEPSSIKKSIKKVMRSTGKGVKDYVKFTGNAAVEFAREGPIYLPFTPIAYFLLPRCKCPGARAADRSKETGTGKSSSSRPESTSGIRKQFISGMKETNSY